MATPPPAKHGPLEEFTSLERRRLFGGPPLRLAELERWQALRGELERDLGGRFGRLVAAVERRACFRFPLHLEVSFRDGDALRSACMENVSQGGIFLATERPLPARTPLQLSIAVPDGRVSLRGTVAWVRPASGPAGPAGMGVRFEALSEAQQARIAAIVAAASAPTDRPS